MESKLNNPNFSKGQGKDTQFKKKSQRSIIFLQLFKESQNSKMLHIRTGIPREDITRRKRDLENEGLLKVTCKDYCPITGRLTQFLSTNPMQWDKFNEKSNEDE